MTTDIRYAEDKLTALHSASATARIRLEKLLASAAEDTRDGLTTEKVKQIRETNVKLKAYRLAVAFLDHDSSRSEDDRLREVALMLLDHSRSPLSEFDDRAEAEGLVTLAQNILFGRTI